MRRFLVRSWRTCLYFPVRLLPYCLGGLSPDRQVKVARSVIGVIVAIDRPFLHGERRRAAAVGASDGPT